MTNISSPTLDSSSSLRELLDGDLDGLTSELLCALQELRPPPSLQNRPESEQNAVQLQRCNAVQRLRKQAHNKLGTGQKQRGP